MPSSVPAGQSQAGTMSLLQSKLCLLLLQPQERQGDAGRRSSVCSTGCCFRAQDRGCGDSLPPPTLSAGLQQAWDCLPS